MLKYRRMYTHAFRCAVLTAFIALPFIPSSSASTGTLHEEAVAYRQLGFDAQQRGDRAAALSLYQKAAALDPSFPAPYNDIGVLLEEKGRFEEAEQAYQKALAVDPKYLGAYANLAMLYERLGEREKAVFYWLKRYQLGDPYDPWTSRAEERLVAFGLLKKYPGLKGTLYTRRRLVAQELRAQEKSLEEFHAATEEFGDWPPSK